MENVILELFSIRDCVHLSHLATSSQSEHKALGGLYEGLTDLIDSLVETYQGKFGRLKLTGIGKFEVRDSNLLCNEVLAQVEIGYKETKGQKGIENILADIENLANHTKYLLTLK